MLWGDILISIYIYIDINQLLGKCRVSQFLAMNLASKLGHVQNPTWKPPWEPSTDNRLEPHLGVLSNVFQIRTRTQIYMKDIAFYRCFSYISSCRPPWLPKIPIPTYSYQLHDFCRSFLNTAFKFDGWFTIYSRVCPMNPVFSLACSYFLRFHHGYQLMNIREVIHFCWNFHGHGFVCCRLNILNPRSFGDLRASFFFCHPMFLLIEVLLYVVLYCFFANNHCTFMDYFTRYRGYSRSICLIASIVENPL